MKKSLINTGVLSVFILCFLLFLLYHFQESLIYHPNIPSAAKKTSSSNDFGYRSPGDRKIPYDEITLKTDDNLNIESWFLHRIDKFAPTIIFFHENAGNIGMRMDILEGLYKKVKANVFIFSYRGYGKSEGSPNEKGIELDAQAAIEYVFHSEVDKEKVFLYGKSLGGAVAIYSAWYFQEKYSIKGLILENTFTSMGDMVDIVFPFLSPVKHSFLRNKWPNIERISSITAPILFISGEHDELIPSSQMVKLRNNAKSTNFIEWKSVKEGDHNGTWYIAGKDYWDWIQDFIKSSLKN